MLTYWSVSCPTAPTRPTRCADYGRSRCGQMFASRAIPMESRVPKAETNAADSIDPALAEQTLATLQKEMGVRNARRSHAKEGGLIEFVRYFWSILEPETKLVEGWLLYDICNHLEAVTFGKVTRLLINVPPGSMKS